MEKHALQRILVRSPNWIGDQVLAFPFFHYLRKNFPHAEITVCCVPWVADLQFRTLVDRVIVLPPSAKGSLRSRWRNVKASGRALSHPEGRPEDRYDLAIALPNSFSSALTLWQSHAKIRRGYATEGRSFLLNSHQTWEPSSSVHRAQAYLELLPEGIDRTSLTPALEFFDRPAENELDADLPGEMANFDYRRYWPLSPADQSPPLKQPSTPYWVLAPGATAESRRWPLSFWAELALAIYRDRGWPGLIVGGPSEAPLARELIHLTRELAARKQPLQKVGISGQDPILRDTTARGSIPTLAPLFQQSEFTVTNESGLAHVAALCGAFVQIVCGAADPKRTRPIGPGRVQIAVNPIPCWPCERNECALPEPRKIECLRGISAELVWSEILRGLEKETARRSFRKVSRPSV